MKIMWIENSVKLKSDIKCSKLWIKKKNKMLPKFGWSEQEKKKNWMENTRWLDYHQLRCQSHIFSPLNYHRRFFLFIRLFMRTTHWTETKFIFFSNKNCHCFILCVISMVLLSEFNSWISLHTRKYPLLSLFKHYIFFNGIARGIIKFRFRHFFISF